MRIKQAEYVKDYKIKLLFSDGITKIVDFKPLLKETRRLFIPLLDQNYFKSFYVDEITICWPNKLDFSPDFLYEIGKDFQKQKRSIKTGLKPLKQRRSTIKPSKRIFKKSKMKSYK